ncbi:MFS transporter [Peribacillus frigoritolerans]|uniref:MFS transporter n=1 Tax=Peribacillus castrilensis TaxID=2897690 RepID=UPI002DCF4567|nr:MFS transporter [Peribacillus castrilensis]MEC0345840.1 MFS transporter [Peribacillus castrilensis]
MDINIRQWRNALFTIFALSGISFASWISRTPEVRDVLGASTATMGWIIFGLALGSIVGLLSASRFIARTGSRYVAVFSTLLIVTGLSIIGLGSFITLKEIVFIGLIVCGLGYGLAEVAISVEGVSLEHAANKTLLPALHGSFSAGTLIGAGLGSLAIAMKLPIVIHLILISVLGFVTVLLVYRFIPEGTGKEKADSKRETTESASKINVWKEPKTLLIGVIVLGMAFAEGSANDWLPLAMVDGFHVDHVTGTIIYGVFLTAMLIGRVTAGVFLDKYGRVPVLRFASVLAVIGIALVIFNSNLTIGILGVFIWGLGASIGFPVGLSAAGDNLKGAVERVGAVSIVGYSAFLIGPPILGLIGDVVGLLNAFIVVLITVIIAGFVSHAARKPTIAEKRPLN